VQPSAIRVESSFASRRHWADASSWTRRRPAPWPPHPEAHNSPSPIVASSRCEPPTRWLRSQRSQSARRHDHPSRADARQRLHVVWHRRFRSSTSRLEAHACALSAPRLRGAQRSAAVSTVVSAVLTSVDAVAHNCGGTDDCCSASNGRTDHSAAGHPACDHGHVKLLRP